MAGRAGFCCLEKTKDEIGFLLAKLASDWN
jgi:hypothetical protein